MQVVNRACAICEKKIHVDRQGRVCPKCAATYHANCVPEAEVCPACRVPLTVGEKFEVRATPASRRPLPVTAVGWYSIVSGGYALLQLPLFLAPQFRELLGSISSVPFQIASFCAGSVVSILAGIGILRGRKWARNLFVIWDTLGLVIAFVTLPEKFLMIPMRLLIIPALILLGTCVYLLFRPDSRAFFAAGGRPAERRVRS